MLPTSFLANGASNITPLLVDIACLERNLQVNLYCLLDLLSIITAPPDRISIVPLRLRHL